jgi:phosphoglycerate kinase
MFLSRSSLPLKSSAARVTFSSLLSNTSSSAPMRRVRSLHVSASPSSRYSPDTPIRKRGLNSLGPADVAGKTVLVRVDFNVPLRKDSSPPEIADDTRILSAVPTIRYLMDLGAKVVLTSHLGRPKGSLKPELSLRPVAKMLSALLHSEVQFSPDCVGDHVRADVDCLGDGRVLMLENVRFHPGEEKNDRKFAQQIVDAVRPEVFVNDAFGTAHRAHASTQGVVGLVPGPRVAGFLLEKELQFLAGALRDPTRPFCAIVGGAKVSSKIAVLDVLLDRYVCMCAYVCMCVNVYIYMCTCAYTTGATFS